MHIVPQKKQPFDSTQGRQPNGALSLRAAMNQMFDESFWDPWKLWDSALPTMHTRSSQMFVPSIDIAEDAKNITVVADVPGYNTDDIEVTLDENTLTLQGKMKHENQEQDDTKKWICKQCSSGSFYQRFTLPSYVDSSGIKCKSKNGKLTVTIPKKAKEETIEGKKLPIETE